MINIASFIHRYYEPHRKYHDIRHIQWMLMEFHGVMHLSVNPVDVEAAIWFHDAIYEPLAHDNEERCVELARKCLGNEMTPEIERLIMLTKHNTIPEPGDIDGGIMVDCDLSILGADQVMYDAYERGIREEYRMVPEDKYREGRLKVLNSFLSRKQIYCTHPFINRYEESARHNLMKSCKRLQQNGLDALAAAIEKARGGPAPGPMMQAFA